MKIAELTFDDLANYGTNGTTYISNAEYNSGISKGTKIKWDYKTGGKQNYTIKVVKDTANWGFGVDNNDVISIYYPDGTPVAENIKLKNLTKDVAKSITKITKGNEGKSKTLSIDLSKETFESKGFLEQFISDYNI